MRFLFVTNPGIGHLNPMLPVALALCEQGHEVRIASAPGFRHAVEQAGFAFESAGMDWDESAPEKVFPEMRDLGDAEWGRYLMTDIFADVAALRIVPDVIRISRQWSADLVVRNDYEFGSCVAAEVLGLPHATISICFFMSPRSLKIAIGNQLAYLRSVFGLPPNPPVDMLYPYLYLCYAPESCQPRAISVMHSIRPYGQSVGPHEELPSWIRNLPDRPLVYVSLGTVFNRSASLFKVLLEAFSGEQVSVIVTVGRNQKHVDWGPQPAHIRIEEYISQDLILPRCSLFVTHSPFYTAMSGLWHGVPLLAIPIGGDQMWHAARLVRRGVGVALRQPWHADPELDGVSELFSADSVRAAACLLLTENNFKEAVCSIREEMRTLPDRQDAARRLVALANDRSPQHD